MELKLEMNETFAATPEELGFCIPGVMMTPAIGDKDYWLFRVQLSQTQAIIGFPKFSTIGIGFLREDTDWNTNLPYKMTTPEIFNHIKKNKDDDSVTDEDCLEAIRMVQGAATKFMKASETQKTTAKG